MLGSKIFDNTSMSQGELWVHYVRWFLEHQVDKGNLALLDEPEAFLAARGHRPFIDEIARHALSRDLQIIIGTHSAEVLSRFPITNIRMCVQDGNGIRVVTPESHLKIRENIGLETPVHGLVLVEDEMAGQLLSGIFAHMIRR
jgi:predicted ATP-dependent endonuclease of OLD family